MNSFYFKVGESTIRYTPTGMWGHRVWQNAHTYVCSGIKRTKEGSYEYRFTAIGENSILLPEYDAYNDIFIHDRYLDSPEVNDRCEASEISIPGGWIKFYKNINKRQLKRQLEKINQTKENN